MDSDDLMAAIERRFGPDGLAAAVNRVPSRAHAVHVDTLAGLTALEAETPGIIARIASRAFEHPLSDDR